jgi:hypothetical protein
MAVLTGGVYAKNVADPIGWGVTLNPDGSVATVTGPTMRVSAVAPDGVVTANVGSLCIVNDPAGATVWIKATGSGNTGWTVIPTPSGSGKGNLDILQAYIDTTSAAIITLGTLNPGDVVEAAEFDVYTGFDGVNPSVSIGSTTDPIAYTAATSLSRSSLVTYDGGIQIAGAETAKAYLSLGGSAAGSARVTLSVRRA